MTPQRESYLRELIANSVAFSWAGDLFWLIDALRAEVETLKRERDEIQAGIHGYIADLHTCKNAACELISIQGEQARMIADLEAKLAEAQQRIEYLDAYSEELADLLKVASQGAERKLAESEAENERLKAEAVAWERQLYDAERALQVAQDELKAAQERLAQAEADLKTANQFLADEIQRRLDLEDDLVAMLTNGSTEGPSN